jgi:hypothetical protein
VRGREFVAKEKLKRRGKRQNEREEGDILQAKHTEQETRDTKQKIKNRQTKRETAKRHIIQGETRRNCGLNPYGYFFRYF